MLAATLQDSGGDHLGGPRAVGVESRSDRVHNLFAGAREPPAAHAARTAEPGFPEELETGRGIVYET